MNITGFHLLLTYQCTFACDHCFVWGSPFQSGVMSLGDIQRILQQARELGTVSSIYFEGGEPFLYYATLLSAVKEAAGQGFEVGIVSNAYWATSQADALAVLTPFAAFIQDLSVSSDLFHYAEKNSHQVDFAQQAALQLGIPCGTISIAKPGDANVGSVQGQLPPGESKVMYRGRAAIRLADKARRYAWKDLIDCPYEDLRNPGRVHIDPFGNLHICQGILLGNLFSKPVIEICAAYAPERHPVVGPLLEGGPAGLVSRYGLEHSDRYADACHLCYEARQQLRAQEPVFLGPDQVYGADL